MPIEVEQKFPVADRAALDRQLAALGFVPRDAELQVDQYFAHPARDFARTDEALRIRRVGQFNYITYKGPKLDATTKTRREIEQQQRELSTITEDQKRLRANLKEMPATAQAYKRYLEKFDKQETQIEKYQADIKKLQAQEHSQQKALDDFLVAFSAE